VLFAFKENNVEKKEKDSLTVLLKITHKDTDSPKKLIKMYE